MARWGGRRPTLGIEGHLKLANRLFKVAERAEFSKARRFYWGYKWGYIKTIKTVDQ